MKTSFLTNHHQDYSTKRGSSFRHKGIFSILCGVALGLFTISHAQAQFSLGGAANYNVLQSGNGGNVTMINATNTGNIGVGSQNDLTPQLILTGSSENGNVDFASAAIVSSTASTITGTTSSNVAAVNSAFATLSALSTSLGAIGGTSLSISLSGGASQTILAGNGVLSDGNRVFDVSSSGFNFNGYSTLIIDGQNLGNSVVLNFKGFASWGLGAGRINLIGGLTPDQVLWNTTGSGVYTGLNSYAFGAGTAQPDYSFSGVFLNPLGQIDVYDTILHGRLYGGNDSILINNSKVDAIPEPSTYALLGIGLIGVFILHRRSRKAQTQSDDETIGDAKDVIKVPSPAEPKRRKTVLRHCWM
jgi:hypothetical protein